jgi:hypothetical protein
MKDIYKEMEEDILTYHKGYPVISMMLSCQRYPFISIKPILGLIRIKGYLGIS